MRWLVIVVVAACSHEPEILYPPVTGHQATPFSLAEPCELTYVTEYVENAAAGATLRGTVVDTSDRPAIGAIVFVDGRALVGGQQTMTDDDGRYNIGALPPGDYALTVYYENRRASHRLDVRRGVESIDHARTVDHDCRRLSQLHGDGIEW